MHGTEALFLAVPSLLFQATVFLSHKVSIMFPQDGGQRIASWASLQHPHSVTGPRI
jgi:hypothetical protein